MTEPGEFCESCQRWLEHDRRHCPLFPMTYGPTRKLKYPIHTPMGTDTYGSAPIRKWKRCTCLEHACHEAEKRDKAAAPACKDFS